MIQNRQGVTQNYVFLSKMENSSWKASLEITTPLLLEPLKDKLKQTKHLGQPSKEGFGNCSKHVC